MYIGGRREAGNHHQQILVVRVGGYRYLLEGLEVNPGAYFPALGLQCGGFSLYQEP